MRWKPIETSPTDGRDILLFLDGGKMIVAQYCDTPDANYCWHTLDGPAYHAEAPTHWMLLPPPPSETGGE